MDPEFEVLITAVTPDSLNKIFSPSVKETPFKVAYSTVSEFGFSKQTAIAPLDCPTISSPITTSDVVADEDEIFCKINDGAEGSAIFEDSNIAYIFVTSGTFKQISSSCTLVPYG